MSFSVLSSGTARIPSTALLRLNPIASQRAKREIEERRSDIKTYTFPIIFAGDVERGAFLQAHHKKFLSSKKKSVYRLHVIRKHPTTVGKFYHDLVEHSGRVTAEKFWLRYDYRCCDIARVLRELQSLQQESKKQLAKEKKRKGKNGSAKDTSQVGPDMKESTRFANVSRMNLRGAVSSKKSLISSTQGGLGTAATVDTVDEEHHGRMAVNHVEHFKKSLGVGHVTYAPPAENDKGVKDNGASLGGSNLPSIFRSSPQIGESITATYHGPMCDFRFSAPLIGLWLLTGILALVAQSPTLWMNQASANRICSPIRPGTVLEAAQIFQSGESFTLKAPWWVPSSMKDKVFHYVCAPAVHGSSRIQTQLTCKMQSRRLFQGGNVPYLSTIISQIGGEEDGKVLIRVRSSKSLSVNSEGTKLIAEKHSGGLTEYESPWAFL
jgi:hypothetical protein